MEKLSDKAELARYKRQIRKELSLKASRSQAMTLIGWLGDLGPGAAAEARRSDRPEQEEH